MRDKAGYSAHELRLDLSPEPVRYTFSQPTQDCTQHAVRHRRTTAAAVQAATPACEPSSQAGSVRTVLPAGGWELSPSESAALDGASCITCSVSLASCRCCGAEKRVMVALAITKTVVIVAAPA
jgi:hypothetical protein